MGRRMQRIVGLGLDGSRVLQVENKDPKSAEDGQELREVENVLAPLRIKKRRKSLRRLVHLG